MNLGVAWEGSVDPMCLGFEEGNERGRGGLQISGWWLARVYARARLRECHGVVSTMEIFGRGLSVQDEGQAVCRGSSALGGERGGRCVWGCCEHQAPRSYGEEVHRRARGARVGNPRGEPWENERGVRVDDAPS